MTTPGGVAGAVELRFEQDVQATSMEDAMRPPARQTTFVTAGGVRVPMREPSVRKSTSRLQNRNELLVSE